MQHDAIEYIIKIETILICNDFRPNGTGRTALHIIADKGQLEAAKLLRASGKFSPAAVRLSISNDNRTALDIAKGRRDTEMIALLKAWMSQCYGTHLW